MGFSAYAKDIFIIASILSLLVVGLALALRSGVVSVNRDGSRQLWNNASHLVVALAGCVAFLLMVQQIVGIRMAMIW